MTGIFSYIPGNAFLHRLNPLTKLITAFVICISAFISDCHFFILGLLLINILFCLVAGISQRAARLVKGLIKLSVFFFLIQIFFVRDGEKLLNFPLNIYITDKGLSISLLVVLRLITAAFPLAVMLSVTRINDLANVMVKKLFVPYKYAFALTTAIRFVPVFAQEMAAIIEAQTSRGVEFDTKNFLKKIGLIFPLCVPLLMTSVKKAQAGAMSAEIRGFDLRTRASCSKEYPFKMADAMSFVFCILILAGAVILNTVI